MNRNRDFRRSAFTLVELLISLTIVLLLTAVALPTFRELMSDQKLSRSARSVVAFLNQARVRAVTEKRIFGVRIERLDPSAAATADALFPAAAGVRLRQLVGAPPYSGESADSVVEVSGTGTVRTLVFRRVANHQLLTLHGNDNPPITEGDLIQFPDGKSFPLTFTTSAPYGTGSTETPDIGAQINVSAPVDSAPTFPAAPSLTLSGEQRYKIYRRPSTSSSNRLGFARGVAIDFTVSGYGSDGNELAPFTGSTTPRTGVAFQHVDILFSPDGGIRLASPNDVSSATAPPTSLIYLCLGDTDGILPTTPLANSNSATANLKRLDSIWIVINPATGRIFTAPNATSSSTDLTTAISEARFLARLGDTIDSEE